MKCLLFTIAVLWTMNTCFGQKPPIDSSVYGRWPSVAGDADINANGEYVLYSINNQPAGSNTLVLQGTRSGWRSAIEGVAPYNAYFTENGRFAVFKKSNDSLGLVSLGGSSINYLDAIKSFKLQGNWLAYQVKAPEGRLVIRNLADDQTQVIDSASDFTFGPSGKVMVIKSKFVKNGIESYSLTWLDLHTGVSTVIWSGAYAENYLLDVAGTQIAFVTKNTPPDEASIAYWLYKAGTQKAFLLADNKSLQPEGVTLGSLDHFSGNGLHLFFKIHKQNTTGPDNKLPVIIWSYRDAALPPEQLTTNINRDYLAEITLAGAKITRLCDDDEYIDENPAPWAKYAIIKKARGNVGEINWNQASQRSFYLVNLENGERKLIIKSTRLNYRLSPGGKYLTYYDPAYRNYFSYEIKTGKIRNITQNIPAVWTIYGGDTPDDKIAPGSAPAWLPGDKGILLADQNDIWQADPLGKRAPVNLTKGLGKKNHISFRFEMENSSNIVDTTGNIILSAFNRQNKENGFYRFTFGSNRAPEKLAMGPYLYDVPGNNTPLQGWTIRKAAAGEHYLVRRMSATESPNYFVSDDLENYSRLSNVRPEKNYNWFTTQLVNYKTPAGLPAQGVLYKPENFDPRKKYPVIFYYYETLSDRLNEYFEPEYADGRMDIPTYVSNGYLVFTPDIHYKIGKPGQSAVTYVSSAAKYLSTMPWVDAKRMGLQGLSYGAIETNFILTHNHLFAAACSASGIADFISGYGSLAGDGGGPGGGSLQVMYERTQDRMGATLWDRPDFFIKNSAVFTADKITTPILMMETKDDGVCLFPNAVEFFTALRRLGKKAWMLEYENDNHGLYLPGNQKDFTLRMQQFFDHYLKGASAPKWMVESIPVKSQSIGDLTLEPHGVEPGPNLLTPEEQRKADSLQHRKPITVTIN